MGRQLFLSERDEKAKEKRRLLREKNGFVPGAHKEEDSIRNKNKKLPKTKRLHQEKFGLWLDFTADPENGYQDYKTFEGCEAPSHDMVKQFIRWLAKSTLGRLTEGKEPTVRSAQAWAEQFFGGFAEFTKTEVIPEDRTEVYQWIRNTLTLDKVVVNKKKQKYNFTKDDFLKVVSSIWQIDHKKFIPGLIKVDILFALQLYLFTGARVGSFMPSDENKHQRGLRYEHIDLVLFPSRTDPWEVGWRVNQVWLKNNRDSEYTVFGIGIRDSSKPQFASGEVLLSLALEHGALFGIESVADLAQYDLSNGEIPLRWKKDYLSKPIFRNVTADGPQDIPLTQGRFTNYLHQIFVAAGYTKHPTIHCLRRNLAKEVELSQILAHRDPNTFPEHYQAHCSSIDTVSAILNEEPQSQHIEYFQGYGQFCEPGLPLELPAHIKESILMQPEMVEIQNRIENFESCNDEVSLRAEKLNLRESMVRKRRFELKQYQSQWVQWRRDQKILSRGKDKPVLLENDIFTRAQSLIMPEVGRIATAMALTTELSFKEKLLFVQDLQTQCSRDFDVVYLPNEEPIEGLCPSKHCQVNIESLKKCERSAHTHKCIRREKAIDLQVSEARMRYCYECMEWYLSHQWRDHCAEHLQSWQTRHCEVIKYRHTVIRPGYCPFCLSDSDLPADKRLDYWPRSCNLREHIESQHIPNIDWPLSKPLCGCIQTFDSERQLRYHLHDKHGLHQAIWKSPKLPRKRKRSSRTIEETYLTEPIEEQPKKLRFCSYSFPTQQFDDQIFSEKFLPAPHSESFATEDPQKDLSKRPNSLCSSSRSSFKSGFSAVNSPLSSRPTTPGLEAIDPKILEPIGSGNGIEQQACDEAAAGLNSLSLSTTDFDTKKMSLTYTMRSNSPASDLASEQPGCDIDDEARQSKKSSRKEPPTSEPPNVVDILEIFPEKDGAKNDEGEYEGSLQEKASDRKPRCHIPIHLTKTRSQQPRHHLAEPSPQKLRQKLYAKERRKMLEFKSQNLTLRQIGPRFADIDTAFLRQAWQDLELPQRCTRSGANRMARQRYAR
ncbi:hypothetical protein N7508_011080 [Penicillium antarcticum]|uniref:uncharacterized protein n=1 Tax=Penicillium antarcticum TaxID=416450 RepID=UPI0023904AF6|nr:uncharacterized protein N7508_011080 [Penicillium antarcticum]KAJ5288305.1 hypothetical protein N7508_011080 [Penicillium antarcticum]